MMFIVKKDKGTNNCECGYKNIGGVTSGGIYGMATVGALVYYLQGATSFQAGMIGVFKAIFWPAFLIHKLLGFLQM